MTHSRGTQSRRPRKQDTSRGKCPERKHYADSVETASLLSCVQKRILYLWASPRTNGYVSRWRIPAASSPVNSATDFELQHQSYSSSSVQRSYMEQQLGPGSGGRDKASRDMDSVELVEVTVCSRLPRSNWKIDTSAERKLLMKRTKPSLYGDDLSRAALERLHLL